MRAVRATERAAPSDRRLELRRDRTGVPFATGHRAVEDAKRGCERTEHALVRDQGRRPTEEDGEALVCEGQPKGCFDRARAEQPAPPPFGPGRKCRWGLEEGAERLEGGFAESGSVHPRTVDPLVVTS